MPQLMPFYWINSVFMILYIFFSLILFYFYKSGENLIKSKNMKYNNILVDFKW